MGQSTLLRIRIFLLLLLDCVSPCQTNILSQSITMNASVLKHILYQTKCLEYKLKMILNIKNKTQISSSSLYLNDSKIAVFGVCTQVKNVPFHINCRWKTECDNTQDWTTAVLLKLVFLFKVFKVTIYKYFHNSPAFPKHKNYNSLRKWRILNKEHQYKAKSSMSETSHLPIGLQSVALNVRKDDPKGLFILSSNRSSSSSACNIASGESGTRERNTIRIRNIPYSQVRKYQWTTKISAHPCHKFLSKHFPCISKQHPQPLIQIPRTVIAEGAQKLQDREDFSISSY